VIRIGNGYDSHRVVEGRALWLGCVQFEDAGVGLEGHSDADVVAHAICDALLGAAGLGDIGQHFPDSEERYRDYPGKGFLARVSAMVIDAGYEIVNVDCVVLCEVVRLGGRKRAMEQELARHLDVDESRVNVKATTNEGRGAVGRGEIVACHAVALLESD
jgi:2-C-methyl-D-erythritol 2,4-cyclodiphosphate synthase